MSQQPRPRMPTFLIIGAQKAATSTLWAALRTHEQVYCPGEKEPKFFVAEEGWSRGLHWYADLFRQAGDARAIGEASTTYTWHPWYAGVPDRILSVLPDARFLYLLRDPVERMRSAYAHSLATGFERRPIEEALLTDTRYLYPSLYALQTEQYLRHVPRERLLLATSEAFRANPQEVLRRVLAFIGVDPELPVRLPAADLNVSETKRAPRGPVRWLRGVAADRPRLAQALPDRLVAYRARSSPVLTRVIARDETVLSAELRARLLDVVRPDIVRLRDLADGELDPAELARWETG